MSEKYSCFQIIALIAYIASSYNGLNAQGPNPDSYRNTTELIISKGYICEDHFPITDDGYFLGMQRVIPKNSTATRKPAVLMIHGLLDSSSTWVLNEANTSLGFILADAGYDVWLGNTRGNVYSIRHKTLSPDTDEFWNFGLDEMVKYDLPAMINYVLKVTNQTSLYYIGHSQGTSVGFAGFSVNQELASKVKLYLAMGPTANVGYVKTPLAKINGPPEYLNKLWYTVAGRRGFVSDNVRQIIKWLGNNLCPKDLKFCDQSIFLVCGPTNDLNQTRVPVYLSHYPSGASSKNVLQFSQMVYSKKFQMFDYGSAKENMKYYNQTTAPLYNLKDVRVPTVLFTSGNDWLADPQDVQILRDNLPNIVYEQYVDYMDHLDFIWGIKAPTVIYPILLELLKKY